VGQFVLQASHGPPQHGPAERELRDNVLPQPGVALRINQHSLKLFDPTPTRLAREDTTRLGFGTLARLGYRGRAIRGISGHADQSARVIESTSRASAYRVRPRCVSPAARVVFRVAAWSHHMQTTRRSG
jgi:hypothetical protein